MKFKDIKDGDSYDDIQEGDLLIYNSDDMSYKELIIEILPKSWKLLVTEKENCRRLFSVITPQAYTKKLWIRIRIE